ncbi:hypothetical protein COHA_006168 [Chlorella ohadii]|uniref:Uncharacterized protein n=1 Tax=Chlorella ohadii TaxID=2649997 RepID=A0AAD5DPL6_9CHLO|nr:hypothetical protein COHA_006168 [Chlorella ohadii]
MVSARGVAYFALLVSLASAVVCVVGLAGLQSVCQDDIDSLVQSLSQRTAAVEAAVAAADNSTVALFNATQPPFRNFASTLAQSSSFMTCAKRYSLSWWAWVLQVVSLIATPIALTGGRLPAMGLPLLLATTALLVMQTEVCTRSMGLRSYSPAGQSGWASTVLAGFIMAAASSWLLILSLPQQLRAEERRREQLGALAKEIQL